MIDSVLEAFKRIAELPSRLQTVQDDIVPAGEPAEIAILVVTLQGLLIAIDEISDILDSVSATISLTIP